MNAVQAAGNVTNTIAALHYEKIGSGEIEGQIIGGFTQAGIDAFTREAAKHHFVAEHSVSDTEGYEWILLRRPEGENWYSVICDAEHGVFVLERQGYEMAAGRTAEAVLAPLSFDALATEHDE